MTDHVSPFSPRGGRAGDGGPSNGPGKPAAGAVARARRLRKTATVAERLLWEELRKRKLNVRRQVPIGRYIADFASHDARLVIEVDGPFHNEPEAKRRDAVRTAWLETAGYRVIRFPENAVRDDLYTVADRIASELSPPTPTLPPSRGKGAAPPSEI
jgi:very-short-patch-repair endonuclease